MSGPNIFKETADALERTLKRIPWPLMAAALDHVRAQKARERALAQTYVEGPFETGRAFRRRHLGERGYRFGRGEMAVVKTGKRKRSRK